MERFPRDTAAWAALVQDLDKDLLDSPGPDEFDGSD